PQHWIMGTKLLELLKVLEIPTTVLEDDESAADAALAAASAVMDETGTSAALIVRRGLFEPGPSPSPPDDRQPHRRDYIEALAGSVDKRDLVLGTTGYTGRELRQAMPRPGSFYTAGSMGCIGSVGLALAREQPSRRVYVLDGDGALLMKLGTLATIGLYQPANLVHIVFDNGQYESTGGQPTASRAVNFPGLAENSGYTYATSVDTLDEFHGFLTRARSQDGPIMCHVRVQPGTQPHLPRPDQSPEQLRDELRGFLTQ
ncbi:MAG: thiamine pyrophosphate-dependent enzyme, partial [Candidatus Neomarinimicrobiota bacterium]